MKTLTILAACLVVVFAAKCADEICVVGECCVQDGGKYQCEKLQEEGERCLYGYQENYMFNSYSFWCPCMEGLSCKEGSDGTTVCMKE